MAEPRGPIGRYAPDLPGGRTKAKADSPEDCVRMLEPTKIMQSLMELRAKLRDMSVGANPQLQSAQVTGPVAAIGDVLSIPHKTEEMLINTRFRPTQRLWSAT